MAAYLELHVEQGRRLERAGLPLGIVSGIVGLSHWRVSVRGEANHAGTTLPDDRHDALVPVAAAVLEAQRVMRSSEALVATVGEAEVTGGAMNVVPGLARFSLDVRSLDESATDDAVRRILAAARSSAEANGCELQAHEAKRLPPAHMAPNVLDALRRVCNDPVAEVPELPSMAGHDGMGLAAAGVPCGMVFVRSEGGISHSPRERSSPQDCALGAALLGRAALELARELP
jgi:allantoate deiminase